MPKLTLIVLTGTLLATASCSGDDTTIALAAAPASVSLPAGSSAAIAVSIARIGDGKDASVALSIDGLPTGVTGSFDSASTKSGAATLTLEATFDAALVSATLTITAKPSAGDAATIDIPLTITASLPTTITGSLSDGQGSPLGNAQIGVWGRDAQEPVTTMTALDGTFTVPDVLLPFDMAALADDNFYLFVGGTEASPHLATALYLPGVQEPMAVTCNVNLLEPSALTAVSAHTSNATGVGTPTAAATSYALGLFPPLGASDTATVSALQYTTDAAGLPTAYLGAKQTTAVVTADGPNNVTLELAGPVASHTLALSTDADLGANGPLWQLLWLTPGGLPSVIAGAKFDASKTVQVLIPSALGLSTSVLVANTDQAIGAVITVHVVDDVSTLDVTLPGYLSNISPAANANASATQAFSVDPAGDATYTFYFEPVVKPNRAFYVVTKNPSVTRDMLVKRVVTFAAGSQYNWQVAAITGGEPSAAFAPNRMTLGAAFRQDNATFIQTAARLVTFQ